jgi:hypothetical protein
MKNVQVIDGADNCTYSIFQFSNRQFEMIFPAKGQDIEFIEDVVRRMGNNKLGQLLKSAWNRPIDKKRVKGIHGTLFYELTFKKKYYPTKIEAEMVIGI